MLWAVSAIFFSTTALPQNQTPPVRKTSITGTVRAFPDFESKIIGNKRNLWVYLPPGYEAQSPKRYPVLYMQDGQNVFDGMTSYIPNLEWRADEAAEALSQAKAIEPLIIVAVSNAGIDRANEYLPTRRKFRDSEMGGRADQYGKFLTDELMPLVNKSFRTKAGAKNTGLCGSSFGGVVTLHLGLSRPDAFGKLAVVSPSLWWDEKVLIKAVRALPRKLGQRIWVDIGTEEGPDAVPNAIELKEALVAKGWKEGKDLLVYIDSGAVHNEAAWASRFGEILMWLFPAGK